MQKFQVLLAFLPLIVTPFAEPAAVNYYRNGRWIEINNTSYYLRVDEWRAIQGHCYRLNSDHSAEAKPLNDDGICR